jgi:hypothetical protein
MQTTMTNADRLAEEIATNGSYELAVKVGRTRLLTIEVRIDTDIDADDNDGPAYVLESDDEILWASDIDEARATVADMVRGARNAWMEEQEEKRADFAREVLEELISLGQSLEVLRALRAANLIGDTF